MFETAASFAIHPALGIARVGSSQDEFFLGPEVPSATPDAGGRFKDASGRLKRQAARFRIYAYDDAGKVLGEVTAEHAKIEWRVRLVNRKAGWYQFINAMDLGPHARPAQRRNSVITDANRSGLVIDGGERRIAGSGQSGPTYEFDDGRFLGKPVYLGELRTDAAGRLLVLGGRGHSESVDGKPPTTFANNDGWHDDTSDGTVRAIVNFPGRAVEAEPAMLAVTPPNFAPGFHGVVTMDDVVRDLFSREFAMSVPQRPDFWEHIHPIFARLAAQEAVNAGLHFLFGPGSPTDFSDPAVLAKLADTSAAARPFRERLFAWFRAPNVEPAEPKKLPPFYGDTFDEVVTIGRVGLSLTALQYSWLRQWAAGDFTAGPQPAPLPAAIEALPLAEQPRALDRAPLVDCLGGPFHPGIELTWTLRAPSVWERPYRLRLLPEGEDVRMEYGDTLTPAVALAPDGPLRACGPGTLTWWLGVPWQTDEASCDAGYEAGAYLPLPSFWAARVPNHVLDERSWQRLRDTSQPAAQRAKHLAWRQPWLRFLGTQYLRRIAAMVREWDKTGIVILRDGPVDHAAGGFPAQLGVESELAPEWIAEDATWHQLLIAEGVEEPTEVAGAAPLAAGVPPVRPARKHFGRGER
jgi:L-Lysine epsilon oxidase N-terminal/L-lysine epsilon oxidase C-terminal domain